MKLSTLFLASILCFVACTTTTIESYWSRKPSSTVQNAIDGAYLYDFDDNIFHSQKADSSFRNIIQNCLDRFHQKCLGPMFEDFNQHLTDNPLEVYIVTARSNDPEDILDGLKLLREKGYLNQIPKIENIWPVRHKDFDHRLSHYFKRAQIIPNNMREKKFIVIEEVLKKYHSEIKQLQYSDDNSKNIALITQLIEQNQLSKHYPQIQFSVINTNNPHSLEIKSYSDGIISTSRIDKMRTMPSDYSCKRALYKMAL